LGNRGCHNGVLGVQRGCLLRLLVARTRQNKQCVQRDTEQSQKRDSTQQPGCNQEWTIAGLLGWGRFIEIVSFIPFYIIKSHSILLTYMT
jgi:hypothetical protein